MAITDWFHQIVTSHGWYQLAPFRYDAAARTLERVHTLPTGRPLLLTLWAEGDALRWQTSDIAVGHEAELEADVDHIMTAHWPLADFQQAMQAFPRYDGLMARGWGRLLVAPTVWEDLAKTLLTTNTTWAQTRQMTARLCALGTPWQDRHAFPTPQQIAALPLETFSEQARLGYRAVSLHRLAQQISAGLDVEAWRTLPSDDLYQAVRGLRGFGDYAAATMLRLLGNFDRLAIDTECRASFRRLTGRTDFTDREIRAHYTQYGAWQGLVMWMDMIYDE